MLSIKASIIIIVLFVFSIFLNIYTKIKLKPLIEEEKTLKENANEDDFEKEEFINLIMGLHQQKRIIYSNVMQFGCIGFFCITIILLNIL